MRDAPIRGHCRSLWRMTLAPLSQKAFFATSGVNTGWVVTFDPGPTRADDAFVLEHRQYSWGSGDRYRRAL